MINIEPPQQPIVITGVGGSGTRVIAKMLIDLGFFLGHNLDPANDNLAFSVLFMRPEWFLSEAKDDPDQIQHGLDIFTAAMTRRYFPTIRDTAFFKRLMTERTCASKRRTRLKRLCKLVAQAKPIDPSKFTGWGWKEPISHIYIEHIIERFPKLRWMHVIRSGLDMAYSKNQRQVHHWGSMFGVEVPSSPSRLPQASLSYWAKSNLRALDIGERLGREQFLSVNFDRLCQTPESEIDRIITFLNMEVDQPDLDQLYALPKRPKSTGRYRQHDLSVFPANDLETVSQLGFAVEP